MVQIGGMPRTFNTPEIYTSPIVSALKQRVDADPARRRDFAPMELSAGQITFKLARHFGFCYGVENAIEIAYRAVRENPDKRVFLLSEMIHNPMVNKNLRDHGVEFLLNPDGSELISYDVLTPDDVVILPAFGVTVEIFEKLAAHGVNPRLYNATCPFVEKVWRRAAQLGEDGFTVVLHGKHYHEETRATFSHAAQGAHSIIVRTIEEAKNLASYINGNRSREEFEKEFAGKYTDGFDPSLHLERIGVVNQTTMLADETKAVAQIFRDVLASRYGEENVSNHFADTRDTLCYATTENQTSVQGMVASGGDLAIVVGGFNSSNTAHLAKLCAKSVPAFHIEGPQNILNAEKIDHFDIETRSIKQSQNWFPSLQNHVTVLVTAGASTPDSTVDSVIERIISLQSGPEILTQYHEQNVVLS